MQQRQGISMLTGLIIVAAAAAMLAAPQAGKSAGEDPDATEVYNYRLTMDKIQKASAATGAVTKMLATNSTLKQQMDSEDQSGKSLDQRAKAIDSKYPQVAAIIHSNGLATREYILVTQAFISDIMMVGMKKEGVIKDYPPKSVSPENAAYLEQNFDKLKDLPGKMMPSQPPK